MVARVVSVADPCCWHSSDRLQNHSVSDLVTTGVDGLVSVDVMEGGSVRFLPLYSGRGTMDASRSLAIQSSE